MKDQEIESAVLSIHAGGIAPQIKESVTDSNQSETKAMGEGGTRKLVVCAAGIFFCYFYYGILQEKITKGEYKDSEGKDEKFHYTLCLVLVQCFINATYAKIAMSIFPKERDTTNKGLYAACAFTYLGAMLASNHALQHVPYPTQVLGKSIKPIPVMILGVLIAGKRYPVAKYFCVLLIVMGVGLFMFKDKKSTVVDENASSLLGIGEMLLLLSLTLDGLTGAAQDKMRSHYKTGANNMMFYVNIFSVLYLSLAVVLGGELFEFLAFAQRHPSVWFNMISFSLASAIGQMFIFITVTTFGPLTCSIITTTRKFFTILASVIIFQNPISSRQWFGTGLVFVGLGLDSVYGKEKKKRT